MNEAEEMRIGKFIGGLREELREKMEILQNLTFEVACSSALIFEKYARKKSPTIFKPTQVKSNTITSVVIKNNNRTQL